MVPLKLERFKIKTIQLSAVYLQIYLKITGRLIGETRCVTWHTVCSVNSADRGKKLGQAR